jgi:hypothetical protein
MEAPHELRCASRVHGVIVQPDVLEVRCHSRFCGKRAGVVILHRFEISTGKLLGTREYKTIEMQQRRDDDGTDSSSVWYA